MHGAYPATSERQVNPLRRLVAEMVVPGGTDRAGGDQDLVAPEIPHLVLLAPLVGTGENRARDVQAVVSVVGRERSPGGDAESHRGNRSGGADGPEARVDGAAAPEGNGDRVRELLERLAPERFGDRADALRETAAAGAAREVRVEQLALELGELVVGSEGGPGAGAFAENPSREPGHVFSDDRLSSKLDDPRTG